MTSAVVLRSRPRVGDVRKWLVALGVLTAGNMTRAEAEMKLRAYVPLLIDRFPAAAFTQASLDACATRCKFFPSYYELIEALAAWWHDNRPAPPALPAPEPEPARVPPTPDEIAAVEATVREVVAALRVASAATEAQARQLDVAVEWTGRARPLTPAQLDAINPLPNGRKRTA